MTTKKAKKVTFRQRLRVQSEERLEAMTIAMSRHGAMVCKEAKTEINPYDVMRLLSGGGTKSLRYRLVTELSNEVLAELEEIYNRQQDLPLKDGKQGDASN